MADETSVAVALGSNLGDRLANLRAALAEIESRGLLHDARASDAYETEPEREVDGDAFLNAVVVGRCPRAAPELLRALLGIEASLGRLRRTDAQGGPRTIDLDLILFGDAILDADGIVVPHPRFHRRAFVLVPLVQVAPEMIEPRSRRPVHCLLADLGPVALTRFGSLRK